jgi:hypothetical protein
MGTGALSFGVRRLGPESNHHLQLVSRSVIRGSIHLRLHGVVLN